MTASNLKQHCGAPVVFGGIIFSLSSLPPPPLRRINTAAVPRLRSRGPAGATIFSLVWGSTMEDFSLRIGGWGGYVEGRNGRGRRRAAVGDQLTPAGGIFSRSPTWGNGGLEVLQPAAPLGRGASSPIDADLAPPSDPIFFRFLPDPGADGGGNSTKCSLFLNKCGPNICENQNYFGRGRVCVFFNRISGSLTRVNSSARRSRVVLQ